METLQYHDRKRGTHISRTMYLVLIVPLLCLVIPGALFLVYFSPHNVHASGPVRLPGHVPGLLRRSQLLGPTDPHAPITLLVGLSLRNQASLEAYVNNATHSSARHHLTPEQIAIAYGPLPVSQQAVLDYMQHAGFTVKATFKHHLLISFSGTIAQTENAFSVQINNYRAPSGRLFYAATTDPTVPASLAGIIQSVSGLDTAAQYSHPPLTSSKTAQASVTSNGVSCPQTVTGPTSYHYYVPSQIASIYNLNGLYSAGFHGEGQSVALYELDDYLPSDITAYTSCFGGGSVPISRILVGGGTGQGPGNGAVEVELDMQLVLSAAPHLAALRVYEAPNTSAGVLAEWSQIVSDAVPVVSTSWGACEPVVTHALAVQENALFTVAAAQGQSIFAASGDHGTNDCDGTNPGATETVDDPASQPYVTGVGGTTLQNVVGTYPGEQGWSGGTTNGSYIGSGGGVSTFWTMPTWQQGPGVIDPANYSSTSACAANTGNTGKYCREVPDVALNADPNTGYPIYYSLSALNRVNGPPWTWATVGGTSSAAPLWAAMTALANQKSLHDGNFNLGFLNPLIYAVGQNQSGASYTTDFHDVVSGQNAAFNDGKYFAHANYDLVTGWGSYNALPLAADMEKLAATHTRTSPASTAWYFAEGSVGNSFQEYLTMLNPSTSQTATVTITYLFENRPAVTRQHTVSPSTRSTVSVNTDVGVAVTGPQQAISTIVQSNVPIVAERPLYFNLHGIASGSDVVGATNATSTTSYFAQGDTRQDATRTYYTYVTLLNPSTTQTAHVTITYYSQGSVAGTQTLSVGPRQRGTGTPTAVGLYRQVAIKVTSDIGIVVERSLYFHDNIPAAGGWTTGAASAFGATTLGTASGSDWLFAEGYTGTNFQEYLALANFTAASASVNVKLEYSNGTTQTIPVTVAAQSQYFFDVNNAFSHPIAGCGCTPTATVSAEVTSSTASIVAERLMYFHFGTSHVSGGTDVVGEAGPTSHSVYTFAEGYTYDTFSEYLTLQNPTSSAETVAITLFADNTIVQQMKALPAHSRTTLSINSLIVPLATAYPTNPITQGFEVSMDVQALSGTVVAERPLYFNLHGDNGGTDVLGYTGG